VDATAIEILALLVPTALLSVFTVRLRQHSSLAPLALPLLVSIGSASAFFAIYLWVFQDASRCSGRGDVGCQLNANQGVLTTFGVMLAAVTIWTTLLVRRSDQVRDERLFNRKVRSILLAALGEAHHNLVHVAMACDGEILRFIPQVSSDSIRLLLDPSIRSGLDPEMLFQADRCIRCIDNLPPTHSRWDKSPCNKHLTGVVEHSLMMMVLAARSYPAAKPFIDQDGLQDIRSIAQDHDYICRFLSSDAQGEAHRLRTHGHPVLCWFEDEPVDGVQIYAEYQRFDDMSHEDHPMPT
jgi:hypothetical protein